MINNIDFLQSEEWRKFQEAAGKRTFHVSSPSLSIPLPEGEGGYYFGANIIEHKLPIVGKYFYIPRGPVIAITNNQETISKQISNFNDQIEERFLELIELAKANNVGWIRFDPANEEMLEKIKSFGHRMSKIKKAPHDMQPRETFVIELTKTEEELLAGMKSKTRYNIRLAEKKGVRVHAITNDQDTNTKQNPKSKIQKSKFYLGEFLRLVKITSERQNITSHPENYYRKMFEAIPGEILKLYVAEHEGQVIAANLMIFFGNTAIYLHGASDDKYKNLMAPYLLQWRAIQDAKKAGCTRYDFGGVSSGPSALKRSDRYASWSGITRFKTGFSPNTKPAKFLGSYDIVLDSFKYSLYKIISSIRGLF